MTDRGMSAVVTEKLRALVEAPLRFPAPLACAVLWAGITIAREHGFGFSDRQTYGQFQVFLILGLFLSLSVKLFAESRDWTFVRWLPLSAVALGMLALIVFLGPQTRDAYESPVFLFMGPGLILLTIVAPFLRRGAENQQIWDFNFKSWTSATFGLLVALVLAVGTIAALAAVEELFGLNIRGKIYGYVWIICLSVIWPWQTLAGVPGASCEVGENYCPRWINYLIGWMLAPLALLYLVLLYAFAAKIAIQWTLPEGQVGWLVGGFAGFGLAIWHAAHPLRETGNWLVRSYVRFFHPALFVPVGLLAVGVAARVAEYGVTENRYGLIVLTLLLAGIAVHGVFTRAPRLNVAPITFAIVLILASFGPWGANAVSLHSQLARLDGLLVEAGVLSDGKLSKPAATVDRPLMKRISSVVDYLNRSGKSQALSERLGEGGIDLAAGSSSTDIVAALGMKYINRWGGTSTPRLSSWARPNPEVMDVRDFDAVVHMGPNSGSGHSQFIKIGKSKTRIDATTSGAILKISTSGRGPVTVDLAPIVESLKRGGDSNYSNKVNAPLMTVEARGNGLKTLIYFTFIEIDDTAGRFKIGRLNFIALIGTD